MDNKLYVIQSDNITSIQEFISNSGNAILQKEFPPENVAKGNEHPPQDTENTKEFPICLTWEKLLG